MPRVTLPSLLALLFTGCAGPVPPASHDMAELARAETARARYRALQEQQTPKPLPEFVPVRLQRGPHTEDGVTRTNAETVILVPRTP